MVLAMAVAGVGVSFVASVWSTKLIAAQDVAKR